MDSVAFVSSPNASLLKSGGNLWRSKHSIKNIVSYSTFASKSSQHQRKTQIEYNPLRFQQSSLNQRCKSVEGGKTYQECNKKYVVKAISRPAFDSDHQPHASNLQNNLDSIKTFFTTLYQFCYPYAMVNQIIVAVSASLLAVEKLSDITPFFFTSILQSQIPFFLMIVYINGLNQLADLEIDKINKPHLPLASGNFSYTTGVIITMSSLLMSLWLGWNIGSWPLIWSLVLNTLLWTAYSVNVPFLRWKKNPLLSFLSCGVNLAYLCPIPPFLHMQTFVMKKPFMLSRPLILYIVFMTFYAFGVVMLKDIPDIEGDKKFGIDNFTTRLGAKKVFWICVSLFEMAFGVALFAGISSPYLWTKIVTVVGHAVLASLLWRKAKSVELENKDSAFDFYMFNWKMMRAAYFLLPLIR